MPPEFSDITIKELDEIESYKRSGGFWEKVFKLSSDPPGQWIEIFHELWAEAAFFPKRHARIENSRLVFVCLEEEVNGRQMAGVIEAIATANTVYRERLRTQD